MVKTFIIAVIMLFCSASLSWGQTQKQINDSIADTLTLDEVVVLQKLVKHSVQKDIYIISSKIRERSYSAMDILKNLPGVNIDLFRPLDEKGQERGIVEKIFGRGQRTEIVIAAELKDTDVVHTPPVQHRPVSCH